MAKQGLKLTVKPTWRDLRGRFARAEQALLDERRDQLRQEGPKLVNILKGKLRAKIGESVIEKGIRYRTAVKGDTVELKLSAPNKAKPHPIRPRNAGALHFFWGKIGMTVVVPKGGGFKTHARGNTLWVGKGRVDHPGGSLVPLINPLIEDVAQEWLSRDGRTIVAKMATRYAAEVTKG